MISQSMIPRNLLFSVAVMVLIAAVIGAYMWHVRSDASSLGSTLPSSAHVAPPASGPTGPVTLYVAYDDLGVLKPQTFHLPVPAERQQQAEEVLRDLIAIYVAKPSPHPLGQGSEVRSVYLVDPDLAVIDLNGAFAEGHPSSVLAEDLTVASLIETLSANIPGIRKVKILVEGKTRDTLAGHADLTVFYDVASVHQLAAQLQGER